MYQIGQEITWSTPSAPHPFTGVCRRYSARDAFTRQLVSNEVGDHLAAILHSAKVAISFEAMVTGGSTDFLDLSAGPVIDVGITPGLTLAYRAVERWALEQEKTASVEATHYPGCTVGADQVPNAMSAFTPDQSGLGIVTPGSTIIYGTYGMTHAAGVIHGLTLTQEWTLKDHRPTPAGVIPGANAFAYMRMIEMRIMATAGQPAKGTTLSITNSPSHAADYKIEESAVEFEDKTEKMYSLKAFWISPFSE